MSALPLLKLVCDKILKFIPKFTLFWVAFSAFLVILSICVNFYYFRTYHTKIDTFIFTLKDDETTAILQIIWQDYPVVPILLIIFLYTFLLYKISKKFLTLNLARNSIQTDHKTSITKKTFLTILLNFVLIVVVFIGARGNINTHSALNEKHHHISSNPLINHIATNPISALIWAHHHYKQQALYAPININELKALENELFPVFRHNSQNAIEKNPNVVAVLMESFGTNMLALDNPTNFDTLASFRPHFEAGKRKTKGQNDFVFMNFLSGGNGTAQSFVSLFFISPFRNMTFDTVQRTKIALTPLEIYKKAGYEVIVITPAQRSWQNLGDYTLMLGADAVYDSAFLQEHYPQSAEFKNSFGVPDEFAFKFTLEYLQKAEKPVFVVMITISNHPPYLIPSTFTPPKYDFTTRIQFFGDHIAHKADKTMAVFSYASNAFGDFVSSIKNSNLAQNTIIAGSGDHTFRDFKASHNVPLNHAVPFYLYVPNTYTKDFKKRGFEFDPQKLGSHKDILPTLYALSLNEYDYLSVGGRNLFDKNAPEVYEFALNESVWVDDEGIYPANSKVGYKYTVQNGFIMQTNETFELSKQKAEFLQKYQNLERLQLNYRLFQYGK